LTPRLFTLSKFKILENTLHYRHERIRGVTVSRNRAKQTDVYLLTYLLTRKRVKLAAQIGHKVTL